MIASAYFLLCTWFTDSLNIDHGLCRKWMGHNRCNYATLVLIHRLSSSLLGLKLVSLYLDLFV